MKCYDTFKKKKRAESWYDLRDQALADVVAIYVKGERTEDELNRALDALALAHTAATFEWGGGPIKW